MKSDISKVSYSKVVQTSIDVSVNCPSITTMDYHQSQQQQNHHNHNQSATVTTTTPKTSRQIASNQGRRQQTNQNVNVYNRQQTKVIIIDCI